MYLYSPNIFQRVLSLLDLRSFVVTCITMIGLLPLSYEQSKELQLQNSQKIGLTVTQCSSSQGLLNLI